MASPPVTSDIGCSAATWDIYDEMKKFDKVDEDLDEEDINDTRRGSMTGAPEDTNAMKAVEQMVASTIVLDGYLLEVESTGATTTSNSSDSNK